MYSLVWLIRALVRMRCRPRASPRAKLMYPSFDRSDVMRGSSKRHPPMQRSIDGNNETKLNESYLLP